MGNTRSQDISFAYYEFVAKQYTGLHDWVFMNYGYAKLDETEEQKQNHCEALYAQVAGSVPLNELNVLEVGCGRGGGAAYVAGVFHPRNLIGVDFSTNLIQFCRKNHSMPGLCFLTAEAADLPFHNETFDAVINIESSHSYQNEGKFLRSVARILRPEGYFLFADFRERYLLSELQQRIADAGLQIIMEKDITDNVLHALTLNSETNRDLIRNIFPPVLIPFFLNSAAVVGTIKHRLFSLGIWRYVQLVAKKRK
jgi:ubiquinone/menaquinone biosynthesis C-methylase UbiE